MGIIHSSIADVKLNNFIVGYRFSTRLEWIIPGISFQPFEFVVFTDTTKLNTNALLSPFDGGIRIGCISAILLLVSICLVILEFRKKSDIFLWTISGILQQNDESYLNNLFGNRSGRYSAMNFSLMFSVNLLSMLYLSRILFLMPERKYRAGSTLNHKTNSEN
jgi:hypothetical protein